MIELVENRLYAYAVNSTLLTVFYKLADRPAVAASLNRDLARIQKWCNHWCMILNPNKTKAFEVSRYRTVNPPPLLGDLFLSVVSICASPYLDILGVKFDSKLTFEDHVHGIVSPRVSQRIGILKLVSMSLWTPLCCFVATMHLFSQSSKYCSPVWGSTAEYVILRFVSVRCVKLDMTAFMSLIVLSIYYY